MLYYSYYTVSDQRPIISPVDLPGSQAVDVFRRYYVLLLKLINPSNRLSFAAELFSANLISDSCYDEATEEDNSRSNQAKVTALMKEVKSAINSDPQSLMKLVEVLKAIDQESFQNIANKITADLQ